MTLFLMVLSFFAGVVWCVHHIRHEDADIIYKQTLMISDLRAAYEDEWAKRIDTEVLLGVCEAALDKCMRGEKL